MTVRPIVDAVLYALAEMRYGRRARRFVYEFDAREGIKFR
jgi:hypothetical protein